MSQTFKDFCHRAGKMADKAATKIGQAADNAALYLQEKNLNVKLDEAFEKLGRAYYDQLGGQMGNGEKIDKAVAEIDSIKAQIRDVKARMEKNKTPKNDEEKAEEASAETAEAKPEDKTEDAKTEDTPAEATEATATETAAVEPTAAETKDAE